MAAQVSKNATDLRFSIDQSIISFLAFQRHHAYRELGRLDSVSEAGRPHPASEQLHSDSTVVCQTCCRPCLKKPNVVVLAQP
jgi:hypothetical protein